MTNLTTDVSSNTALKCVVYGKSTDVLTQISKWQRGRSIEQKTSIQVKPLNAEARIWSIGDEHAVLYREGKSFYAFEIKISKSRQSIIDEVTDKFACADDPINRVPDPIKKKTKRISPQGELCFF